MFAEPSPVSTHFSTQHDWRVIYNYLQTECHKINVHLNQVNRFIKNFYQISFYLKWIKFSHYGQYNVSWDLNKYFHYRK